MTMTKDDLKPGDLVQLKSGGPVMTYEGEAYMTGDALCCWFDGGKRMREGFTFAALKRAE
ncbi:YodC family protein [Ruixingdingia sedimenti]|jgi:uncharacterized protein YodC (DUF2158 family)|uniref:DUF2158 domain-containing protein n=1 Tax=Ruixingdingia sedimenti TaxID=3073604 RepID=A0ABU1F4P1_9RHOB|nr:DUF2158 domain-containing protein [Xinfangfangia sp. LG-4]MDR5651832.1 DUF2158 domain-containing protein [Xinfangfangia sp. LG-4]